MSTPHLTTIFISRAQYDALLDSGNGILLAEAFANFEWKKWTLAGVTLRIRTELAHKIQTAIA